MPSNLNLNLVTPALLSPPNNQEPLNLQEAPQTATSAAVHPVEGENNGRHNIQIEDLPSKVQILEGSSVSARQNEDGS